MAACPTPTREDLEPGDPGHLCAPSCWHTVGRQQAWDEEMGKETYGRKGRSFLVALVHPVGHWEGHVLFLFPLPSGGHTGPAHTSFRALLQCHLPILPVPFLTPVFLLCFLLLLSSLPPPWVFLCSIYLTISPTSGICPLRHLCCPLSTHTPACHQIHSQEISVH